MDPITIVLLVVYAATIAAGAAALLTRRRYGRELAVILASAGVEAPVAELVEQPAPDHPFLGRMVVVHAHHGAGVDKQGRAVAGEKVVKGILRQADRWYVLSSASLAHDQGATVAWEPLPYEWAVEASHTGLVQLDASETVPAAPTHPDA